MQYTWQLVLVPVYFIKHSVSCYTYYTNLETFIIIIRVLLHGVFK